jgi:hypothetical protein
MSSQTQRQRLSPSDTRRLIDDYTHYRFDKSLSPEEFGKKAGVSKQVVEDLCNQKQISHDDLHKLAEAINVSDQLLEAIAGYREIDQGTLKSLNGFFEALHKTKQHKPQQKKAA